MSTRLRNVTTFSLHIKLSAAVTTLNNSGILLPWILRRPHSGFISAGCCNACISWASPWSVNTSGARMLTEHCSMILFKYTAVEHRKINSRVAELPWGNQVSPTPASPELTQEFVYWDLFTGIQLRLCQLSGSMPRYSNVINPGHAHYLPIWALWFVWLTALFLLWQQCLDVPLFCCWMFTH